MKLMITDLSNDEVIYFPVLPEDFKVSYAGSFASYQILRTGEIKIPNGVELSSISWDSFFETESLKDMPYVDKENYHDAEYMHGKLERIKIDGRKVRVMLTESPINFDCYLESFQPSLKTIKGRMYYSISFIQAKDVMIGTDGLESDIDNLISYRVHVRDQGWTDTVFNGGEAGTTGKSLRMEAVEIKTSVPGLSVEYCAHCKDIGWQPYVKDGETAGTVGEARRLEAVRIRLAGENKDKYDIFYRLHIKDEGWLDWSKNDAENGSVGLATRAECIQIILCEKGQFFEGDSVKTFLDGTKTAGSPSGADKNNVLATDRGSVSEFENNETWCTVLPNDTLWHIANYYYQDGNRWTEIYEQNKDIIGSNPNALTPGMQLLIPNPCP